MLNQLTSKKTQQKHSAAALFPALFPAVEQPRAEMWQPAEQNRLVWQPMAAFLNTERK